MSKNEVLLKEHGGTFIDPTECGSSVNWCVDLTCRPPKPDKEGETIEQANAFRWNRRGQVYLSADLWLKDCSRSVSWSLSDKEPLAKLDAAILELQHCRDALE